MKNRTLAIVAFGILAVFGVAGLALAGRHAAAFGGPRECGDHPDPAHLVGRLLHDTKLQDQLGLSADQIERLKGIASQARAAVERLRAEVRIHRAELHSLVAEASTQREAIEKEAATLARAAEEVRKEGLRAMLDARDLLTVEQRQRLRTELHQRMESLHGAPDAPPSPEGDF